MRSSIERGRGRLHDYLDINARFDWEPLQDLWSGMPQAVFFNLNGHNYNGRAHWTRLWQFYQKRLSAAPRVVPCSCDKLVYLW